MTRTNEQTKEQRRNDGLLVKFGEIYEEEIYEVYDARFGFLENAERSGGEIIEAIVSLYSDGTITEAAMDGFWDVRLVDINQI